MLKGIRTSARIIRLGVGYNRTSVFVLRTVVMRIIRGMLTHLATSTTTTLPTPIGSPRLYGFARRAGHIVSLSGDERQGTESQATRLNNCTATSEPCEVADYRRSASLSYADVINFDNLYDSALKCRSGVAWKPSVKQFCNNLPITHGKLTSNTEILSNC